jgi:uncharacterized repeat protein (TIGR01451 family)
MRKPNGAKLASYFSLGLTLVAVLALTAVFAAPTSFAQEEAAATSESATAGNSKWQLEAAPAGDVINMNEPAAYIIQFDAPAVASYRGGVNGLAATSPAATGNVRLQETAATQAYVAYLEAEQDKFVKAAEAELSRPVEVNFTYQHAFNGMSVTVTPSEAAQIAKMPGVRAVTRSEDRELLTDVGPAWIGAPGIWDGTDVPSGLGTYGEGVVVAILDTGINSLHPSFADISGDGYDHTNPLGSGNYRGVCNPSHPTYQPSFVCNDKLIGAYTFVNEALTPEDSDGHGSHTAGTVAGNFVVDAVLEAPTASITSTVSGVAPRANIIAYDVCIETCPGDALLAAVNQVVADSAVLPNGIAAINYSISGGNFPYSDPVELAFLAATDAGIFVSASAGNSGPTAATVAHVSPWVSTVAASTHNRSITNQVTGITSAGGGLSDMTGLGFTIGYGPAGLLYAGNFGDALCLNAFAPGTFAGQIVICDRGVNARVDKGANVLAGGAGGMILADNGAGLSGDSHFLPAVHITLADGNALKAWLAANPDGTASISGYNVSYDYANGDVMAGFSSRGPVNAFGVLKPDVTAPGVSIWAAVQDNGEGGPDYGFLSGTSMSSPHNAGAAALMAALYPTWTPHQIKSAMMLTADNVANFKEDGVTPADPFDLGAGRIQVAVAANAGFVLNETTENFENADPALNNGQETALQQLNIASLANGNCVGGCSWERTLQSVLPVAATYTVSVDAPAGITVTVSPAVFTIPAGGTQVIEVEADVIDAPVGAWAFASVDFVGWADGAIVPTTVITDTGTTVGAPTWQRPFNVGNGSSGSCSLSGMGSAVSYVTFMFNVPTTGNYDILSFQDYDGYIHLYSGGFNPADQCVNLIALNDDSGGIGSRLLNLPLMAGTDYYLVTSGFSNSDAGNFETFINELAQGPATALPDAGMPIAVKPSTGNMPSALRVDASRDASSYTLNELEALEITDSQVAFAGPALAESYHFSLAQDPTNGNPYDNLDDVFWTTVDVPAGTARLVAEIVATTSPDIDLFWGSGSMPSAGTQLGASATGATLEYLTTNNPPAGTYWVLVQNWLASAPGAQDAVHLAVGVVPTTDAGTAMFDMPAAQPAGVPFSATLFWDFPVASEGDVFYGLMTLGTDAGAPDNLGIIDLNIYRRADDVTKSANTMYAMPGDVVTYTISVAANMGTDPVSYALTDTIPAGMTYVPGSVTGGAVVNGDTLTWSGTQNPAIRDYVYTTSLDDPSCAMPFANSGAYVNLAAFGINPQASLFGDSVWFTWTTSGAAPIQFYGQEVGNRVHFTDDGFLFFDPGVPGTTPWTNQPIPTAGEPNSLLAMFWQDMEIVYAAGTRGVSLANLSASGVPYAHVLEIDDIEVYDEPTMTYDMQTYIARYADDAPGQYEIRFAYDNINGPLTTGTIGVENATGLKGLQYAFNDANLAGLQNGMAICFDWVLPAGVGEHVITYAATVDEDVALGTAVTNTVQHESDFLGTKVEESDATVTVGSGEAQLRVAHLAPFAMDPGTAVTVTLNETPILTDFHFSESTSYLTVPAGNHDVAILLPDGTVAVSAMVTLATDSDYSAVAVGGAHGWPVELQLHMDDNTAPAAGMAHVRFGHLAPFTSVMTDTLADIRLADGTVVVDDVPYNTLAGYMPLPAGEYDLMVTSADGSMVYMDLMPITLGDGDILYAVAVGDGTNQELGVFAWATDAVGMMLPMKEFGVEFTAPTSALTGTVGTTVTYTVHVTNTGNFTDTFDMSLAGNDWTTTAPMTVTLGVGETAMAYVTVAIPADATDGESDMVTITATSQGNDTVMANVMLTTTAVAEPETEFKLYLPLISKP